MLGQEKKIDELMTAAPLGRRLGAFMIDFLIATLVEVLFIVPFIIVPLLQNKIDVTEVAARNLSINLIMFAYLIFRDVPNGRSIGKKALHLQVRCTNAQPASWGQMIIRNLFVLMYPVEVVWLLATSGRTRLGDIAARTGVFECEADNSA